MHYRNRVPSERMIAGNKGRMHIKRQTFFRFFGNTQQFNGVTEFFTKGNIRSVDFSNPFYGYVFKEYTTVKGNRW